MILDDIPDNLLGAGRSEEVDLVLLSRDLGPPRDDVRRAIEGQTGVRLVVHRVAGPARPDDANRWETIVRARNEAKGRGSSPWLMMLDDDVVLAPDCVSTLRNALQVRPEFAGLAADYNGELDRGTSHPDYPPHVAMGATLFRRARLESVSFRWEPGRCECLCCVDDLRRLGQAVGYLPGARAWHRRHPASISGPAASHPTVAPARSGRVLTAFNRDHARRFRESFLRTLRQAGNSEPVTAIAYDLRPKDHRVLLGLPGVEVVSRPSRGASPSARRIEDFQSVIAAWPEETPVAHWDAGDVYFRGRLGPLWEVVRAHPDRVLAAREPTEFLDTPVLKAWVESIRDPEHRARALSLLSGRPVVNGGFAAGTAGTMLSYFREAARIRSSDQLRGTSDPGDQTAFNLFCHADPGRWLEVSAAWNYCLYGRPGTSEAEGLGEADAHVVHGNGGSLGLRTIPLRAGSRPEDPMLV